MSDEKNIISFTAADIEKYWNGKLSAAEMHAIEKAAMDDPFLADALEGYKNINLPGAGLDTLKERLDQRVGAVVPVLNLKRKRFTWLRAAAAIIIIVGVGLLVQQLVFNDQNKAAIVNLEKASKQPDSIIINSNPQTPDTTGIASPPTGSLSTSSKQRVVSEPNLAISDSNPTLDTNNKNDDRTAIELKKREDESAPAANKQVVASAERKVEPLREKADFDKDSIGSFKTLNDNKKNAPAAKSKDVADFFANRNQGVLLNNKYNYRVVDAQNNPVPFANVLNTRDNVGTYTDIRGNFNLVSSDSVLNVQVRSLGYNSANYKLIPSNQSAYDALKGDLVLKEDERKEILAQNRQVVRSVSRKDSIELEEPEAGWGNYNTYVANNIQIPEKIRPKNTRSDVELSFDIDKSGQPINIKVTRSSQCKECDDEAIRLLKEGPKWKRKGRKSKATVSISVDQK